MEHFLKRKAGWLPFGAFSHIKHITMSLAPWCIGNFTHDVFQLIGRIEAIIKRQWIDHKAKMPGLSQQKSLQEVAMFGVACGTAATMNAGTALFETQDVYRLYDWISANHV